MQSSIPAIMLFLSLLANASPLPQSPSPLHKRFELSLAFSNPHVIIAISIGGGVTLVFTILMCVCCYYKRKQGRLILAAYESPEHTPYEAVRLGKTGASVSSSSVLSDRSLKEELQGEGQRVPGRAVLAGQRGTYVNQTRDMVIGGRR